ncbi:MAG: hypothetical protein CMF22_11230 [Idiomarinaceae bacterium]|nr:hypothetical protein [Idiomarinaceae bacterium]|tara:strand:+ start:141907 stop:142527 length:621 start_codon:yes stop_codon:yes gene_type:complete
MKINETFNFKLDQIDVSELTEGVISDVTQIDRLESAFLQRGDDVIVMAGIQGGRYEWVRFNDGTRQERGEFANRSAADAAMKQFMYDGYTAIQRDGVLVRLLKGFGNILGFITYVGGIIGLAVGIAAVFAGIAGAGTLGLGLLGTTIAVSAVTGGWWAMNVEPNTAATTKDNYGPATNPETIAAQRSRRQQDRQMRQNNKLLRKMA